MTQTISKWLYFANQIGLINLTDKQVRQYLARREELKPRDFNLSKIAEGLQSQNMSKFSKDRKYVVQATVLSSLINLQSLSKLRMRFFNFLGVASFVALVVIVTVSFLLIPQIINGHKFQAAIIGIIATVGFLAVACRYLFHRAYLNSIDYEQVELDITRLVLLWRETESFNFLEFASKVDEILRRSLDKTSLKDE